VDEMKDRVIAWMASSASPAVGQRPMHRFDIHAELPGVPVDQLEIAEVLSVLARELLQGVLARISDGRCILVAARRGGSRAESMRCALFTDKGEVHEVVS
jgi:hypothetical protein